MTFIEYLKDCQPRFYAVYSEAANRGLVTIDLDNGMVTPQTSFLLLYPHLNNVLNYLLDSWETEPA